MFELLKKIYEFFVNKDFVLLSSILTDVNLNLVHNLNLIKFKFN